MLVVGSTESSDQNHVSRHQCNPLSMDGTEVGVGEKRDDIGLACLLQTFNGRPLPSELRPVRMMLHQQLSNKPGKGSLPHEEVGSLLVHAYLPEGYRSLLSFPLRGELLPPAPFSPSLLLL